MFLFNRYHKDLKIQKLYYYSSKEIILLRICFNRDVIIYTKLFSLKNMVDWNGLIVVDCVRTDCWLINPFFLNSKKLSCSKKHKVGQKEENVKIELWLYFSSKNY